MKFICFIRDTVGQVFLFLGTRIMTKAMPHDNIAMIADVHNRAHGNPLHARAEFAVGGTALTLTRDGEPMAVVILAQLTRDQDGTTAVFRDPVYFLRHQRGVF